MIVSPLNIFFLFHCREVNVTNQLLIARFPETALIEASLIRMDLICFAVCGNVGDIRGIPTAAIAVIIAAERIIPIIVTIVRVLFLSSILFVIFLKILIISTPRHGGFFRPQ